MKVRDARWLHAIGLGVLSVLLVGTLWVVPYLPTGDGPQWIFATHVENHYADADAPYAASYVPLLQFASRGLSVVYGPFEAWLGWQRGLQVALSVIALLGALGFTALVRALNPARRALGYLGFPLALSWPTYMGFWSFVIATGLGYFVLALAVRLRDPTWRARSVVAALLLGVAIAHVFGAVLAGAALSALALARSKRGERLAELGRLALTGAPAACVLLASVLLSSDLRHAPMSTTMEWLPWTNALVALPRTIAPGPAVRALLVTIIVVAAGGLALVRARRTDTDAADRGLAVAAVSLLLAGVFAPFQVPGWQAFAERFVPLGVGLALATLPVEKLGGAPRRWASPLIFAAAASYLIASYPFHKRLAALCPDAIAGLTGSFRLRGRLLPVILGPTEVSTYNRTEAEVPFMDPLIHMASLYAAAHGGIPLNSFAGNPAVHPFAERAEGNSAPEPDFAHYWKAINSGPFRHDPVFRHEVVTQLATFGMFYDHVVALDIRSEDLAVWRERGFVASWAAGSAFVAHFEPCRLDFSVPASEGGQGPVFDVRVGEIGVLSNVRVARVIGEDGLTHFDLYPAPCGDVAVRARWVTDGGGVAYCRDANERGDVLATLTRSAYSAHCAGP